MIHFRYVAVDENGSEVRGEVTANSEKQAVVQLIKDSLTVVSINRDAERKSEDGPGKKRLRVNDVAIALYELSSMLNAGVGIADAVASQAQSSAHQRLRWGFKQAAKTLRHGGSFEQAMETAQLPLPEYVHYLIRAGELSGKLGPALRDACEQMQYDIEVNNETRNALIYPLILVVTGILAVFIMFLFVVPSFTNLLEQADQLPWLAWAVLSSGKWANENVLLLMILLLLPPFLLVTAWKQKGIRLRILQQIERLPVVGEWITQADIASWAKVLSSLVRNRVELILALELSVASIRMPARKRRMEKVKSAVKAGSSLSAALQDNLCLNETGYNLIRVGERSGKVESMLNALAELYTEQGRQRTKQLLKIIEPVAILIIGAGIGIIIAGVMMAITSANQIPL